VPSVPALTADEIRAGFVFVTDADGRVPLTVRPTGTWWTATPRTKSGVPARLDAGCAETLLGAVFSAADALHKWHWQGVSLDDEETAAAILAVFTRLPRSPFAQSRGHGNVRDALTDVCGGLVPALFQRLPPYFSERDARNLWFSIQTNYKADG